MSGGAATPAARGSLPSAVALHAVVWLAATVALGLWLSLLLLSPRLGERVSPWSYGRFATLHLDFGLYGALALPLVGLLFVACDVNRRPEWGSFALALWSGALFAGGAAWLSGRTSGKLFVDWSGRAELLFLGALAALWCVLTAAFVAARRAGRTPADSLDSRRFGLGLLGLALLAAVPVGLAFGASRRAYPPIDPASGGPTGASLLGSTLGLVAVVLLLPRLARLRTVVPNGARGTWVTFALHLTLFFAAGSSDASNREPLQQLAVASTALWAWLLPRELRRYEWPDGSRPWLFALAVWGAVVLATGVVQFFPAPLAALKFSHALVGHAHAAMAGFGSSLAILALHLPLAAEGASPFAAPFPFRVWQGGNALHLLALGVLGTLEARDPATLLRGGGAVDLLFGVRAVAGGALLAAAFGWLGRLAPAREASAEIRP